MMTTRATVLAALLALAVGMSACGGQDGSDTSVASLDGAAADRSADDDGGGGGGDRAADQSRFEDAALEYAQCMRDHGIDMPDPQFDDGKVTIGGGPRAGGGAAGEDEFRAADEACHSIMDDAAPEMELTPEEQAEMQDKMLAMAQCMRERGHDMPDPQVADGGGFKVGGPGAEGMDLDDPDFQADMEDCSREAGLPGGRLSTHAEGGDDGSTGSGDV